MWDGLVADMLRESRVLPMNTMMSLLVERIATMYVTIRMQEASQDSNAEDLRSTQKLFLNFMTEFSAQLRRNSQTPEERFLARFKASVTTAVRKVGPDATVRELMPVLAEELSSFGV